MKRIALIASLDTKRLEMLYAKEQIERLGFQAVLIDISTKSCEDHGADISAVEILEDYGLTWERFAEMDRGGRIETMSKALSYSIPRFYHRQLFDAIVSVGGGQNGRMAAAAMQPLPFGVPKIIASSLACGTRMMGQYVGDNDIFVLHTVADVAGLNAVTRTIIENVCHAAAGMLAYRVSPDEDGRQRVAATTLGITTPGIEGALSLLPDDRFEKTCFHANGTGGRCMESLIREGRFDVIMDMTLHEITCELFGGYCSGATARLRTAAEAGIPMVVAPGALDMQDFFVSPDVKLPDDILRRKHVYHNDTIIHTRLPLEMALEAVDVVCDRLNHARGRAILLLPQGGFCDPSAEGSPLYDPQGDAAMNERFHEKIAANVEIRDVPGNINEEAFKRAAAQATLELVRG